LRFAASILRNRKVPRLARKIGIDFTGEAGRHERITARDRVSLEGIGVALVNVVMMISVLDAKIMRLCFMGFSGWENLVQDGSTP